MSRICLIPTDSTAGRKSDWRCYRPAAGGWANFFLCEWRVGRMTPLRPKTTRNRADARASGGLPAARRRLRLIAGDEPMPRFRAHDTGSIRFPVPPSPPQDEARDTPDPGAGDPPVADLLAAFEAVSRRMKDLARELGCLGFFDDDDRPRAA